MKVAGPDVRKLGDLLYSQGVQVSGSADQIVVKGRSGEQIGRVIAEHQIVISELTPVESTLEDVYFELTGGTTEARHDPRTLLRAVQAALHALVLLAQRHPARRGAGGLSIACAFPDYGDGEGPLEGMQWALGSLVQALALLIGALIVTTEFRHGTSRRPCWWSRTA